MSFYAIARGTTPGIVTTWDECKARVDGYKGAIYKKFDTEDDARDYLNTNAQPKVEISHHKIVEGTMKEESINAFTVLMTSDKQVKRIFLDVPFVQKDSIHTLGGKWDFATKKWYILDTHPNKEKIISMYRILK